MSPFLDQSHCRLPIAGPGPGQAHRPGPDPEVRHHAESRQRRGSRMKGSLAYRAFFINSTLISRNPRPRAMGIPVPPLPPTGKCSRVPHVRASLRCSYAQNRARRPAAFQGPDDLLLMLPAGERTTCARTLRPHWSRCLSPLYLDSTLRAPIRSVDLLSVEVAPCRLR